MKNILILCDDYYPSSRATIAITQRFAEGLVCNGYNVCVLTTRDGIDIKPDYPKELNGVIVYDYSDFEDRIDIGERKILLRQDRRSDMLLKIIQRERRLCFVDDGKGKDRWNSIIGILRKKQRERHKILLNKRKVLHRTIIVSHFLHDNKFDIVVSVALPFSTIEIGRSIKQSYPNIKWVPLLFDPFAFDEIIDRKEHRIRYQKEVYSYHYANKIMLLSQSRNDYESSEFKQKIVYFDLPNIRPLFFNSDYPYFPFNSQKINCLFLGNLYLVQRHPKFLFELINKLSDDIVVYIIGGLIDIPRSYIYEWEEKLNGKLIYCGRVSQEEAINSMLKADVLINLGNVTSNQCPSKLIDYICTGKPIINISKIKQCTSKRCLEKYDNKFELTENEQITAELISTLTLFLRNAKNKPNVPYDQIRKTFNEYTIDEMIKKFENGFVDQ